MTDQPTKVCIKCGDELPATRKYFYSNGKVGLRNECKKCMIQKVKDRYWLHVDEIRERERDRAKRPENKKRKLVLFRRRKYGITQEQFEEIAENQQGLCSMCNERPIEVVDHDHKTGEVRGLLCGDCNRALGFVEKYGELARKYLEGLHGRQL